MNTHTEREKEIDRGIFFFVNDKSAPNIVNKSIELCAFGKSHFVDAFNKKN